MSFLSRPPVSSFAMVMGLCGLALVWARVAQLGWIPDLAPGLARAAALLAAFVFTLLLLLYLRKWIAQPSLVREEWAHPVKSSFFAAISVSFALLGTVALGVFAPLALALWSIGALLQVVVMILVLNAWFHRESFQPAHANPAWFIPAVANVVLPLAGVRLGFEEFSWWFFGVGLLFWIVLMSVVMDRLLFVQPPLPDRLLPTLCILLAPPTVGFLSWVQLTKQHPDGQGMDGVGQLLFGLGVFFALFLLSQVRRFIRLPFFMSWWAFSFPTAAFTTSVLVYGQFMPAPWVTPLGGLMVLITTVLILFLLVRTALAIARRETQWVD